MKRPPITPEMIKAGARFNAFAADGRELGQRVVIPTSSNGVDIDRFILICTDFKTSLNAVRTTEELAGEMTGLDAYEPVIKS